MLVVQASTLNKTYFCIYYIREGIQTFRYSDIRYSDIADGK